MFDEPLGPALRSATAPCRSATFSSPAELAVTAASSWLTSQRIDNSHWCAELEGDTILESEVALCLYFLGVLDTKRLWKLANTIRRHARDEGGWAIYPDGPADVSASVKAYLILKLAGDDPCSPVLSRARGVIQDLGGVEACNSFTRIYLALFGLTEWRSCPAVPPEMVRLPRWFPFNLYAMSSWTRAIVVPLSIIWAHRPVVPLPPHVHIDDLTATSPATADQPEGGPRARLWGRFFEGVNRALWMAEGRGWHRYRQGALDQAEGWVLARLRKSDGLGAIFPPIINTLIALHCRGYKNDHPVMRSQLDELDRLMIEDSDSLRLQPCLSPVWDTALSAKALIETGMEPDHPVLRQAGHWLLDHEAREPGDLQIAHPEAPLGGWYFEYANEFYPDCDDTAEVLQTLAKIHLAGDGEERQRLAAIERGRAWLTWMQNRDGGWGAFDRGCDREFLVYVPFADHNAMIDPSTSDITSRAIQALVMTGTPTGAPVIERATRFLRSMQETDGSWYGRWGCNYLYGTWLAIEGLRAAGEAASAPTLQRATNWLRGCQNADGGWGELPDSYENPERKGGGPSTAAQTAWAILGLLSTEDVPCLSVERGIDFLLERQNPDGSWQDRHWTGTGFPKVFYLHYHLYANYFPIQALSRYQKSRQPARPD